jgi:MarR family transcriptional regulator, organic hydroperoxide resistance regulator
VISDNGLPRPILALQQATHRTLHALSIALADLHLTAAEINVLANLADRGALNVSQLSAETGTKASTLTSVLDRLERRGYLVRELDAADRRSFRLKLTELGTTAAAQVRDAVADLEHRALDTLSPDQIAGFHAVITALQEAS